MKFQKNKSIKSYNLNKVSEITKNIHIDVNNRVGKTYYHGLNNHITRLLKSTHDSNDSNKTLMDIDTIYCNLKRDLRTVEEYEEFNDKFSYRKRKYRMTFNKSIEILNLLEKKYTKEVVQKYLVNFDTDFSNIKINEINDLNKLNRSTKKLYTNYNIKELTKSFNQIKYIDCDILTKLNEPNRLRDKFILSEDNIDQLENELVNKKGSLYYKVFNIVKNNKVSKEDTDEWNIIKRSINSFKRNKLLKIDVIELSTKLNVIINNLTELNYNIKGEVIDKAVNDIKKTVS
tara:strand:- start:17927 stop:18790 length:864 start_codon:yes stop_codon:yes gene_type:complete